MTSLSTRGIKQAELEQLSRDLLKTAVPKVKIFEKPYKITVNLYIYKSVYTFLCRTEQVCSYSAINDIYINQK